MVMTMEEALSRIGAVNGGSGVRGFGGRGGNDGVEADGWRERGRDGQSRVETEPIQRELVGLARLSVIIRNVPGTGEAGLGLG